MAWMELHHGAWRPHDPGNIGGTMNRECTGYESGEKTVVTLASRNTETGEANE